MAKKDGDLYHVVGCSNCDNLWIVNGAPEYTSCTICEKRHKFRKLKKIYTTDDHDEAVEARTIKQAEVKDVDHVHEELLKSGAFDSDVKRAVTDEEYLEQKGISITEESNRNRNLSSKQVVIKLLRDLEEPTDDDVLHAAQERYDLQPDEVERLVDKLCMNGEAMRKRDGTLQLL